MLTMLISNPYSKHLTTLSFLLCGCLLLEGCAVNPVTGKNELSWTTQAQEIQLGEQEYLPTQQREGGRYIVDHDLTTYVRSVGQELAAVSDRSLPYDFVVLNNSVPNAWALPGGKIGINRGLLLELNSEAELAAVLSHEIVHAAAKHSARQLDRQIVEKTGFEIADLLLDGKLSSNPLASMGVSLGAQLINSGYGRNAELEADFYGMRYMARAGYDPSAAIALQQTFVRLSGDQQSNAFARWFASHPPSIDRVNRNRETASSLPAGGDLNTERYMAAIAYVQDKQPAYDLMDRSLQYLDAGETEKALGAINDAIQIEPREARLYGAKGDILRGQERLKPAELAYTQAIERDPDYYAYYLGRGLTRIERKQTEAARSDLEQSNALLPTPLANHELGRVAAASGQREQAKRYFQIAFAAGGAIGQSAGIAYTRLDLPDNPDRYLQATPLLSSKRQLISNVTNRSPLTTQNIGIEFSARINGRDRHRVVTVRQIQAGQTVQVQSGWIFSETDEPEQVVVRVTGATLE
jgi:predicted Zn-dependent protease